jgi:peptidyl-prolyl cis-trans isomerase SurA
MENQPIKILVFAGLMFCLCVSIICHAEIIDRIMAIVNQDVITASEVTAAQHLELALSDLPKQTDVLEDRIVHHLVLQQMAKQPPALPDEEEVQAEITRVTETHGGKEHLVEYLNSIGMTEEGLQREIRDQLGIKQFIAFRFRPFVNVTLEQAEKYYNETYRPRVEKEGKEVADFPSSFNEVQTEIVSSEMKGHVSDWLKDLRQSADITIKE